MQQTQQTHSFYMPLYLRQSKTYPGHYEGINDHVLEIPKRVARDYPIMSHFRIRQAEMLKYVSLSLYWKPEPYPKVHLTPIVLFEATNSDRVSEWRISWLSQLHRLLELKQRHGLLLEWTFVFFPTTHPPLSSILCQASFSSSLSLSSSSLIPQQKKE